MVQVCMSIAPSQFARLVRNYRKRERPKDCRAKSLLLAMQREQQPIQRKASDISHQRKLFYWSKQLWKRYAPSLNPLILVMSGVDSVYSRLPPRLTNRSRARWFQQRPRESWQSWRVPQTSMHLLFYDGLEIYTFYRGVHRSSLLAKLKSNDIWYTRGWVPRWELLHLREVVSA